MNLVDILLAIAHLLVPVLGGYLALQVAKNLLPKLDALGAVWKQVIFFGWGLLSAWAGPIIGITLPSIPNLADATAVNGTLIALFGYLIHKLFAPKSPAPAALVR